MQTLIDFMNYHKSGFLANAVDGKPHLRPFEFQFEHDGKFYFCTSVNKNIYKQLEKEPEIEFCSMSENMEWVRLNGAITFIDDLAMKEMLFDQNHFVASIYKDPANKELILFAITGGTISFHDLTGKIYKEISF